MPAWGLAGAAGAAAKADVETTRARIIGRVFMGGFLGAVEEAE
jgi:hypothetical protein